MRAALFAPVLWAISALASAAPTVWAFKVSLDAKPIGSHRFTLTGEGGKRSMTSEARFAARFFAVYNYHYTHDATETWQGNCLLGLAAATDDDGKSSKVNAVTEGDSLHISATGGRQTVQGCLMTFAYWNPEMLQQTRLLNPQTGVVENVRIEALGKETTEAHGRKTPAQHYRITGPKHPIDLWYSDTGEWLSLSSEVDGGRHLIYRLE